MAANIPVRFNKRVAAVFNEAAAARLRPCESSGSEHFSPQNSTNLSDLVNSFLEREYKDNQGADIHLHQEINDQSESTYNWSDSDSKDMLENLLHNTRGREEEEDDDDDVRQKILAETQRACGIIGERSSQGFKRRLMSRLRDAGFDAGLCKSRWEKFGRHPGGDYEYVDVNVCGNRYIVEVFLAGEFTIARPTTRYNELLHVFPGVVICKAEELKQIVRLMCNAIKESMKGMGMHVPPWRRNGYMLAKWFGHYKRTINEIPGSQFHETRAAKRAIGFEALPVPAVRVCHCRDDLTSQVGLRVGYLTAAFNCSANNI